MDAKWAYAALIMLLLFALIPLTGENSSLRSSLLQSEESLNRTSLELKEARAEIFSLNNKLGATRLELQYTNNSRNEALEELGQTRAHLLQTESELNETQEDLEDSLANLSRTKADLEVLLSEVRGMEESINSSIQWFRDNSALPFSTHLFSTKVEDSCVHGGKVNLACINYLMQEELEFEYISESPDRLYSISEMLGKEGGDCEDYSLLLKAILNSIKESDPDRHVSAEAWSYAPGMEYIVYEKGSEYWYFQGYEVDLGDLAESSPYVICFTTGFDEETATISGHCIVAISRANISSIEDLQSLNGSLTFEPQNGEYMGKIGKVYTICKDGEEWCETRVGRIHFVIADDDLYQFFGGEWKSYHIYADEASAIEARLESSISGED